MVRGGANSTAAQSVSEKPAREPASLRHRRVAAEKRFARRIRAARYLFHEDRGSSPSPWGHRFDQRIGIAGQHGEPIFLRRGLPEPGHGEDRLIRNRKPHLAFKGRLAVAKIVLLRRKFAEFGKRHQATVFRPLGAPLSLPQRQVAHVGHRIRRLAPPRTSQFIMSNARTPCCSRTTYALPLGRSS